MHFPRLLLTKDTRRTLNFLIEVSIQKKNIDVYFESASEEYCDKKKQVYRCSTYLRGNPCIRNVILYSYKTFFVKLANCIYMLELPSIL